MRKSKTRRNQKFPKKFDSTLGHPGEGPRIAQARRVGRSRVKVIQKKKGDGETIVSKRTSAERRAARKGLTLRDGVILNKTKQLYAEAFVKLWAWAQRPPPDDTTSAKAYDKFLSGYIEEAWKKRTDQRRGR